MPVRLVVAGAVLACGLKAAGQGGDAPDCNRNSVPDDRDLQPVNPLLELERAIPVEDFPAAAQLRFADVDSDGDLDLWGISHHQDLMLVFENDGRGTFDSATPTQLESSARDDVLADLDGDGDLDVAFVGYGNAYAFWVHFNAGDGTYPAQDTYPLDTAVHRITAIDLDGDGALDLILPQLFLPGAYAYRNVGTGRFGGAVISEDLDFTALEGGDLDGDADADLAALTESGGAALLNDGTGHLSAIPIDAGDSPVDIAGHDLDDDGNVDLVIAGERDLRLLSNRGVAQFDARRRVLSHSPPFSVTAHYLKYVLSPADFDGDGRRDLLVLGSGRWDGGAISFLRNLGDSFAGGTIVARVRAHSNALAVYEPEDGGIRVAVSRWDGAGVALLRPASGPNSRDCNGNGEPDECDTTALPGADCDENGVPDSCEDLSDCDGNGLPDRCDLFELLVPDCNRNGVSDACDLTQGASMDRNQDGVPDECHEPVSDILRLGFRGCPNRLWGAPGEEKRFEVFPTLTVEGNPGPDGPSGWSASIAVEGAMVESTSFQGLHVPTIYDHDGDPGTPPIDPHDLQLADAGFRIVTTAMASSRDPEPFSGAISVAVLNLERKMVLQPNGVYAMARMTIRVKVPGHGQPPASVRLRYRNGLFTGGTSVRNLVTLGSTYWIPRTEACTVQVSPAQPYVRCDANDDLRVDVSDPVWILNELFGGDNGSRTRCQLASDCNGDGAKDISDAISALSFLFIGGRAPPPPFPGCGTGDEASACESGSTACR